MKLEIMAGSLAEKQHWSDHRSGGHGHEQHREARRFISLGENLNRRFVSYGGRNWMNLGQIENPNELSFTQYRNKRPKR